MWVSYHVYMKNTCIIEFSKSLRDHWKRVVYSKNCFEKNHDVEYINYQRDYCIYKDYKNKDWIDRANQIYFFEKSFLIWDLMMDKKHYLEYNDCSQYE